MTGGDDGDQIGDQPHGDQIGNRPRRDQIGRPPPGTTSGL